MKIIGIHGSPHGSRSRTRKLVQWVLEGAEREGADTDLLDLADIRITPCSACDSCSLTGQCINNDDFSMVFEQMCNAEGIVLGSPVYVNHVTGQMKVFIDRLADAIHYQVCSGKYGCSVSTTAISGGDVVVSYLNHLINYLGAYSVGGLSIALGDDQTSVMKMELKARLLGKRLVDSIQTKEFFPDQEEIIAENREFFARIVEENRSWRPLEYERWVNNGWIH